MATKIKLRLIVLVMAFLAQAPATAFACPGCNSILDNFVGRGFNTSIAFMMAMPFLVMGSIVVGIVYVSKQTQATQDTGAPEENSNQTEEKEN